MDYALTLFHSVLTTVTIAAMKSSIIVKTLWCNVWRTSKMRNGYSSYISYQAPNNVSKNNLRLTMALHQTYLCITVRTFPYDDVNSLFSTLIYAQLNVVPRSSITSQRSVSTSLKIMAAYHCRHACWTWFKYCKCIVCVFCILLLFDVREGKRGSKIYIHFQLSNAPPWKATRLKELNGLRNSIVVSCTNFWSVFCNSGWAHWY